MTALTALRSLRLAGNPLPCLALYPQISRWRPSAPAPADPTDVYDEMVDPVLRRRVWLSRRTGEVRTARPQDGCEVRQFGEARRLGAAVGDPTPEEEEARTRRREQAAAKQGQLARLEELGMGVPERQLLVRGQGLHRPRRLV